jgi:hypothetical protein
MGEIPRGHAKYSFDAVTTSDANLNMRLLSEARIYINGIAFEKYSTDGVEWLLRTAFSNVV